MIKMFCGVIEISLTTSIIICIMLIINYICRKKYSIRWVQFLWLLVAIRLLLPMNLLHITVLVNTHRSHEVIENRDESIRHTYKNIRKDIKSNRMKENERNIAGRVNSVLKVNVTNQDPDLQYIMLGVLSIVWVIGVIVQILRYGISYIIFIKRINIENQHIQDEKISRGKGEIKLYESSNTISPFSYGIFNKKIILPKQVYSDEARDAILCHEYSHLRNRDIEYKMLLCIVKVIHWFNPMVYKMESVISQNMELICDEEVVLNRNLEYRQMYGKTIMDAIGYNLEKNDKCFVSYFNGAKGEGRRMKERMRNIIRPNTRRKSPVLISLMCIGMLLASLFTVDSTGNKLAVTTNAKSSVNEMIMTINEPVTVLVTGCDNVGGVSRTDVINILKWDPKERKLSVRNLNRNMYVTIPGESKNKLGLVYSMGGISLLKETVNKNFSIPIDYVASVDYKGFEKIIDLVDGVKVGITKQEANYLNDTNYISNRKNRTLVEGENYLNGNQALGYLRVRNIATESSKNSDFGRMERLHNVLDSLLVQMDQLEVKDYPMLIKEVFTNIDTDLSVSKGISLLTSLMSADYEVSYKAISIDGSYSAKVIDKRMIVMTWEKNANLKEIQ